MSRSRRNLGPIFRAPHFHAKYGDDEIVVHVRTGHVDGRFPRRALVMVLEWLDPHREELIDNWNRLAAGQPPAKIDPLP